MSTQLTRPTAESAGAAQTNGSPPGDSQPKDAPAVPERACKKCGAPLAPLQDWCLQCGAGAPGSLSRPSRRAAIVALALAIVLVLGAGAAAYAALSAKGKRKPLVPIAARLTPAATATPTIPSTPATPPASTAPGAAVKNPGTPTTIKATPPKIPLQTPTPSSSSPSAGGANEEVNSALFAGEGKSGKSSPAAKLPTAPAKAPSASSKPSGGSSKASAPAGEGGEGAGSEGASGAEPPSPILLDTNAAATYNPNAYPSSLFGDPSLAIDGEAKTAWIAPVDPATAPKMAVGLVLDCKSAQKVGSVTVKTATTGVTVTVFAANGHNLPASITDHAWKRLTGAKVLKKKTTTLQLKTGGTAYRFILLWITKAPAGSTPSKPGSVSIGELELFPPK